MFFYYEIYVITYVKNKYVIQINDPWRLTNDRYANMHNIQRVIVMVHFDSLIWLRVHDYNRYYVYTM